MAKVPTRIKYTQSFDQLQSQLMLASTKLVYTSIDTNTLTVYLYEFTKEKEILLQESTATSLQQAKRLSKKMLKDAGVLFLDEIRRKRLTQIVT